MIVRSVVRVYMSIWEDEGENDINASGAVRQAACYIARLHTNYC